LRRLLGVLLGFAALVALAWIPVWFAGATDSRLAFALLSLTPVVPVAALVIAVVAGLARFWWIAAAAAVTVVVLALLVVPRGVRDAGAADPAGGGPVVATANLQYGRADAAALVALVREHRVSVLALQELTPDAERRLGEAGLFAELPFRATQARDGALGTGIVARVPLTPVDVGLPPATSAQVSVRADLPGLGPVELLAVHPTAPFQAGEGPRWVREITDVPRPPPGGPARVVLGDFNATLDHRPLRTLLATGYRDAADEVGSGLVPTWPTDTAPLPRFAAIDHALLAGPVAAASVDVRPVPGSDHATLIATLGPPP
jgi:endonuclease/exonuclease/phosphatase family metal-dependent hydrolase